MKNFYEATIIRPNLKLDLRLDLLPIGSLPCLVKINDHVYYEDTISRETSINCQLPLSDPIDITVQIRRHHPDAVQIKMSIDGFDILPRYQHLATPPTDYLDTNDIWAFSIPNFYPWYHQITGQGWVV